MCIFNQKHCHRYMAEILPIRRKTLYNQPIKQPIKSFGGFSAVSRLIREYFTHIHWTCRGFIIAEEVLLDSSVCLAFTAFKQGFVFTVRHGASFYRVSSERPQHFVASHKKGENKNLFLPGSKRDTTKVIWQSNNNVYLIGNVCNSLTFSQAGFVISDSNCLYSIESYNMVSSFHINSKTIPTKKNAPDTPSPTARGSAGSGGQSVIKNKKYTL